MSSARVNREHLLEAVEKFETAIAAAEVAGMDTVVIDRQTAYYMAQIPQSRNIAELLCEAQRGNIISGSILIQSACGTQINHSTKELKEAGFIYDGQDPKLSEYERKVLSKAFDTIRKYQQIVKERRSDL